MEENNGRAPDEPGGIKKKSALVVVLKIAATALVPFILLSAAYFFVRLALPDLLARRGEIRRLSPLVAEAKSLRLTYDGVVKSPETSAGKPAVWCLQNRGKDAVYYEGDESKRIEVVSGYMPEFHGDKHAACVNMLVVVRRAGRSGQVQRVAVDILSENR